ncbi:MAG: 4-hydroxythreonine-4-phosphate dehydrogenase PdxA, partial [Bacteroidota bacterium]|nr:4-hydroxythreonine-4-phosphate dehydrogenase PdxA [Bacteroidota bacterium]
LKIFEDRRLFEFFTPLIFGPFKLLENQKKHFKLNSSLVLKKKNKPLQKTQLNVFDIPMPEDDLVFGEASKVAGKLAIESLKSSIAALKNCEIDALVTAPINKETIQSEDFKFPGHTDYLAKKFGGNSLMFMVSESLKVALVTDHIALKDVPKMLTPELLREKTLILENSLKQDFNIQRPKIALLGLNPHTGDKGVIGKEDDQVIRPLIKEMSGLGHLIHGPYAADSFFGHQTHLQFDAVLAIYHDQGLIPFKTLTFGEGVNYTAGLSSIRTSPDHGTAFEIAGKGLALTESFRNAMFLARSIYFNRKEKTHPTIKNKIEK